MGGLKGGFWGITSLLDSLFSNSTPFMVQLHFSRNFSSQNWQPKIREVNRGWENRVCFPQFSVGEKAGIPKG